MYCTYQNSGSYALILLFQVMLVLLLALVCALTAGNGPATIALAQGNTSTTVTATFKAPKTVVSGVLRASLPVSTARRHTGHSSPAA